MVAKTSFLVIGGTNVVFLGGKKVNLVEGGNNVVVAVAKTSQRRNVGGKKVAASFWAMLKIFVFKKKPSTLDFQSV